jgi:hypothetical protein
VSLAAGLALSGAAPGIATTTIPGHPVPGAALISGTDLRTPYAAPQERTAAQRRSRLLTEQQEETQDPDERAAGGEVPETGEDDLAPGTATLLLTPSNLVVAPGSRVRMTLSILGAADLRRLPITIRFDPDVVDVVDVALGSAWTAGQQPILLHDLSRAGELVVGLGQLARAQSGISGSAELLELELLAKAPGDAGLVLERFAAIGDQSRPQATIALTPSIAVR